MRRAGMRESSSTDGKQLYDRCKRIGDAVLSALLLVFLSPVMALIALAILLDDPSASPIFAQTRVGLNGRLFTLYKFRTMHPGADAQKEDLMKRNEMQGPVFKMKDDPRVTRLGKFLRRSCADELPQLVNLLMGDMSLVGPRPGLPEEVAGYDCHALQRLQILPGITCLWQSRPDRYSLTFGEWVELDLRYIRERDFLLDCRILLETLVTVVEMNGI